MFLLLATSGNRRSRRGASSRGSSTNGGFAASADHLPMPSSSLASSPSSLANPLTSTSGGAFANASASSTSCAAHDTDDDVASHDEPSSSSSGRIRIKRRIRIAESGAPLLRSQEKPTRVSLVDDTAPRRSSESSSSFPPHLSLPSMPRDLSQSDIDFFDSLANLSDSVDATTLQLSVSDANLFQAVRDYKAVSLFLMLWFIFVFVFVFGFVFCFWICFLFCLFCFVFCFCFFFFFERKYF